MNKGLFGPELLDRNNCIVMSREEHERITELQCGDKLMKAYKPTPNITLCPECGEALEPVWSYCPWCGQHFED